MLTTGVKISVLLFSTRLSRTEKKRNDSACGFVVCQESRDDTSLLNHVNA